MSQANLALVSGALHGCVVATLSRVALHSATLTEGTFYTSLFGELLSLQCWADGHRPSKGHRRYEPAASMGREQKRHMPCNTSTRQASPKGGQSMTTSIFELISRSPHFSILGCPWMPHSYHHPLLKHVGLYVMVCEAFVALLIFQ